MAADETNSGGVGEVPGAAANRTGSGDTHQGSIPAWSGAARPGVSGEPSTSSKTPASDTPATAGTRSMSHATSDTPSATPVLRLSPQRPDTQAVPASAAASPRYSLNMVVAAALAGFFLGKLLAR